MLTLYSKDFKTKYGTINSTIEAFVEEERNGLFELSFIMLNTDKLFSHIKEDNIVVANANDTLLNQKFRIYMTRKLMNNRVEVFARHISFDLMYDYIDSISFENQSCEYALNQLFRNSNFSKHYRGYSDIVNAQNYNMSMANVLEAIGGKEGSIIDTFGTGAEILRDNTNIYVLNKRGHDNGVSIEYAKNLTGFELEEDTTNLVTRILPYAKYTNNETNEEVIVKADYVDSTLIANYSHPFISAIDYSEKFKDGEEVTTSKLIKFAQDEFKINKVDIPKQNFKIDFIPLSKCVGYEGIEDRISLCDTVTIKDTRYNINTKAKVIKTVFNVLKNRYESMELGEPRTSLGDIIGNNDSTKGEKGDKGDKGDKGEDGSIGDFPNSLPITPVVTTTVYGFANIEVSWTFENKIYYQYEVYASKEADFTPNTFNLIHQGQTSSFMYQAKPNETWYFKVCCINTHGERTAFGSAYATTSKIDDLSNYVSNMAIDDALIGTLRLDRGWVGTLRGNYIDAKQLSVTDGNGKRTLDIDSFGNVSLDVNDLKIKSSDVASESYVKSQIQVVNNEIKSYVKENELDSLIQQKADSVKIAFNNISDQWEFKEDRLVNKQDGYTTLSLMDGRLNTYSYTNKFTGFLGACVEYEESSKSWIDGVVVSNNGNSKFITLGRRPNAYVDNNVTRGDYVPMLTIVTSSFNDLKQGIYCLGNLNVVDGCYAKFAEYITVPRIKCENDTLLIYTQNSGSYTGGVELCLVSDQTYFRPQWNNGAYLGSASNRFKGVYLVSSPSVSSDATLKENIEYIKGTDKTRDISNNITTSDMYEFIRDDLKLATYNYIDSEDKKYGFIAQDIENTKEIFKI